MICHAAQCLGKFPDDVAESLTLPRLADLNRYWQRHPPAHLLLAAYVGYKPPADLAGSGTPENLGALVAWFKTTGGKLE